MLEHIGDIIACEPVIGYAKKNWPDRPVIWVTLAKYTELLESHPDLDYLVIADNLVEAAKWSETLPACCGVINLHFNQRACPVTKQLVRNSNDPAITMDNYYDYGSLLEIFSKCGGLPALSGAPHFYLTSRLPLPDLPKPYVVFHCLSNETRRDWDPDKWQKLFYFFADQKISVAEVGLQRVIKVDNCFYHDLTYLDSLQKVAGTINGASFFVGIDSGLSHMANALSTEGVVIMGAYCRWNNHVPFTGLYSRGRIVRHPKLPARYVSVKQVVERYWEIVLKMETNNLTIDQDRSISSELIDPSFSIFPNHAQRLALKLCRPLVKRLWSKHEYKLFKTNPHLLFIQPDRQPAAFSVIRSLMSVLGPVPPRIEADQD